MNLMDELLNHFGLSSSSTRVLEKISFGAVTVYRVHYPHELMWHFLHNPMNFLP